MKEETKIVRGNFRAEKLTGAIEPPIYQTTTYVLDEIGKNKGFDYTRASNPTRQILEEHLALIENGNYAVAFSSGLSACDSVFRLLKPKDHIIASQDMYGGVSRLLNNLFIPYGLEISYMDTTNETEVEKAIKKSTKMLWVETPSNPNLCISDLEKLNKISKEYKLIYAVDSTFATPYLLKPLDFGADLVVQSTTKYLSGHNQIIGGAVITNNKEFYEKLKFYQKAIGAVPSPFECFLTILGLKTLHLRMKKHCENASIISNFLNNNPEIKKVIYPGLPNHPQHKIAKKQMKDYSGIITFELKGSFERAVKFMNNLKICCLAESLGGTETMITHPASMTHTEVPKEIREKTGITDTLIRLSVGLEDPEDIIQDLVWAIENS